MKKDHEKVYGLSLIESEKVEAKLHSKFRNESILGSIVNQTLIITNRRIIKIKQARSSHETTMMDIGEFKGLSITVNKKSFFHLLWGILGIIGGVGLYYVLQTNFNNTVVSASIGLLSILLGLLLMIDFITSQEEKILTIYSDSFNLNVNITYNESKEIKNIVSNIFDGKTKTIDGNTNPLSWPNL